LEACRLVENVTPDLITACEEAAKPSQAPPSEQSETEQDGGSVGSDGEVAKPDSKLISFSGYDSPVSYDVFERALVETELGDLIRGRDAVTIYLPSDGALARFAEVKDPKVLLEPRNRPLLTRIVSTHIIATDDAEISNRWESNFPEALERHNALEEKYLSSGGVIHTEANYGRFTVKTVDRVFNFTECAKDQQDPCEQLRGNQ